MQRAGCSWLAPVAAQAQPPPRGVAAQAQPPLQGVASQRRERAGPLRVKQAQAASLATQSTLHEAAEQQNRVAAGQILEHSPPQTNQQELASHQQRKQAGRVAGRLAAASPYVKQPGTARETGSKSAAQRRKKANSSPKKQKKAASAAAAADSAACSEQATHEQARGVKKRSGGKRAVDRKRKKDEAELAAKETDALRWYSAAVQAAEQAHKSFPGKRTAPSLGDAVRQPLQEWLDGRLQYMGFDFRPFPQLLPLSLLLELGVGASSDSQADEEEAASMCTSHAFARWAQSSESSLPLLASQWHDVGESWDLHNPGLLLHEGHAAHEYGMATQEHAQAMIALYEELARDVAGLPVVAGRRSPSGALSGAAATFTLEAMVCGGRALQVAQSHDLADNFSRSLNASYGSREAGEEEYACQMGSGLRAALLGGTAIAHGDAAGLVLPPALAPVQAVITPVPTKQCNQRALAAEVERIRAALARAGVRVAVDARRLKPVTRFRAAEQMGVPLRIEIGPQDIKRRTCTLSLRSTPGADGKLRDVSTDANSLAMAALELLGDMQTRMCASAAEQLQCNIVDVTSFMELREVVDAGMWARGPWAGSMADEVAVYEETGATLRCFPLQQPVSIWSGYSTCLYSGYQASEVAIFARAL